MKGKLIPSVLILITFLFCLINLSQARMAPWADPRYPSEHPWQDSDSPPRDDNTITPERSPGIWIFGVPTKIIILRISQVKPEVKNPLGVKSPIDLECPTE
jgi:hypothetical protein